MKKNQGNIAILADSLRRITETPEQYFDTVREMAMTVLRGRG